MRRLCLERVLEILQEARDEAHRDPLVEASVVCKQNKAKLNVKEGDDNSPWGRMIQIHMNLVVMSKRHIAGGFGKCINELALLKPPARRLIEPRLTAAYKDLKTAALDVAEQEKNVGPQALQACRREIWHKEQPHLRAHPYEAAERAKAIGSP